MNKQDFFKLNKVEISKETFTLLTKDNQSHTTEFDDFEISEFHNRNLDAWVIAMHQSTGTNYLLVDINQ